MAEFFIRISSSYAITPLQWQLFDTCLAMDTTTHVIAVILFTQQGDF